MIAYIYKLTQYGEVVYVGSTLEPNQRAYHHRIRYDSIEFEVIEEASVDNTFQRLRRERFWIRKLLDRGATLANVSMSNTSNKREIVRVNKNCTECLNNISRHDKYIINPEGTRKHRNCAYPKMSN